MHGMAEHANSMQKEPKQEFKPEIFFLYRNNVKNCTTAKTYTCLMIEYSSDNKEKSPIKDYNVHMMCGFLLRVHTKKFHAENAEPHMASCLERIS